MIQQEREGSLNVLGIAFYQFFCRSLRVTKGSASLFKRSIKADRIFNPDPFADAEASADEADENTSSNKVPSKIHVRVQRTCLPI